MPKLNLQRSYQSIEYQRHAQVGTKKAFLSTLLHPFHFMSSRSTLNFLSRNQNQNVYLALYIDIFPPYKEFLALWFIEREKEILLSSAPILKSKSCSDLNLFLFKSFETIKMVTMKVCMKRDKQGRKMMQTQFSKISLNPVLKPSLYFFLQSR